MRNPVGFSFGLTAVSIEIFKYCVSPSMKKVCSLLRLSLDSVVSCISCASFFLMFYVVLICKWICQLLLVYKNISLGVPKRNILTPQFQRSSWGTGALSFPPVGLEDIPYWPAAVLLGTGLSTLPSEQPDDGNPLLRILQGHFIRYKIISEVFVGHPHKTLFILAATFLTIFMSRWVLRYQVPCETLHPESSLHTPNDTMLFDFSLFGLCYSSSLKCSPQHG